MSIVEMGDGEEYYRLLQDNLDHLVEEVSESRVLGSAEATEAYLREKRSRSVGAEVRGLR